MFLQQSRLIFNNAYFFKIKIWVLARLFYSNCNNTNRKLRQSEAILESYEIRESWIIVRNWIGKKIRTVNFGTWFARIELYFSVTAVRDINLNDPLTYCARVIIKKHKKHNDDGRGIRKRRRAGEAGTEHSHGKRRSSPDADVCAHWARRCTSPSLSDLFSIPISFFILLAALAPWHVLTMPAHAGVTSVCVVFYGFPTMSGRTWIGRLPMIFDLLHIHDSQCNSFSSRNWGNF